MSPAELLFIFAWASSMSSVPTTYPAVFPSVSSQEYIPGVDAVRQLVCPHQYRLEQLAVSLNRGGYQPTVYTLRWVFPYRQVLTSTWVRPNGSTATVLHANGATCVLEDLPPPQPPPAPNREAALTR